MRVPLSWLSELTPLSVDAGDRRAVRELGATLDSLGLVVEAVERVPAPSDEVVLARVLEIAPIPGADRIRQVLVDEGTGEARRVVCGATNFAVGDVVPLAKVGAELPGGMVIRRREMRGVASDGMLCSARELGLGSDSAGLLVLASTGAAEGPLPGGVELGMRLGEHLGLGSDVVYDIAVEPNRPDCLSIAGVARDLAARRRLPFELPSPRIERRGPDARELASVSILAPEGCHHLLGRVVRGIEPLPSPPLVARRLLLAGMRPIGSVVDASNYVMLELGQPSHPYDLDALGGRGLTVRYAAAGERLVTLDGVERRLGVHKSAGGEEVEVEDLLICDSHGVPVGLAGVMGGASTEIGRHTSSVLLEVAEFSPLVVGRSAKRQGLRTEASARFERGIDPEGLERAADRFCELLAQAAAAAGASPPEVAPGDLDDHPLRQGRRMVPLRVGRVNALLGTSLTAGEIQRLIEPIGFTEPASGGKGAAGDAGEEGGGHRRPGAAAGEVLEVGVPSYRPDVGGEVDVIEEVARMLGYERIGRTHRRSPFVGTIGERNGLQRRVRRLLAGLGAHEAWTSSIVDPTLHRRAGHLGELVELANPMVSEESALRAHLLPGLLAALRHNAAHRNGEVRLFEIGHVFSSPAGGEGRPDEREHLGVLLSGPGDDAVSAVGAWRVLSEGLGLDEARIRLAQGSALPGPWPPISTGMHPTRRGLLIAGNEVLGAVGEVDPEVLEALSLPASRRVGWLVVDLGELEAAPRRTRSVRPVSRFPSSDIDLSFVLDDSTPAGELERALVEAAGPLAERVRLLGAFRGGDLPRGTRSLAYRIRFCATDRTLTDAEVRELRSACIEAVTTRLPAALRG